MRPSLGCVVLTEGRRPEGLRRALDSLLAQRDVDVDVVVVGNGWEPTGLPNAVRRVALTENAGVPGGRNAGVDHVQGDLLLFLDDDASFPDEDALARVGAMFAGDPTLGAVSLRIVDPSGRPPPRYWVPRIRVGDRARSGEVAFPFEAAVVFRRTLFDELGGWPGSFFFYHEGADIGWRIWDAGYRIWYAGDVVVLHPAPTARRGGRFYYFNGRNRVWLARRNLPLPLAAAHAGLWFLRMVAEVRSVSDAQALLRGYADGLRLPPGERRPLRWQTIWRLTLAGRPPVV